jgi:hypothetical protein
MLNGLTRLRQAGAWTRRRLGCTTVVRSGYPMEVRPAAASFFQPRVEVGTPATVTQLEQLRDRDGRLCNASYLLQRQTGAGWRISGCVVAAESGKSSA